MSENASKDDHAPAAEAATELERARRDLEVFASAASHDLQEPLRIVTSFLRLLDQRYSAALDDRGKSYVANAVDGAQRMEALLRDLADYSRVTTRAKPFEPTDADAALARALALADKQVQATRATVSHARLEPVVADGAQLVRVLHNLLDNAMKFRKPTSPNIRVAQERAASEWIFSVTDDGIGFEMQYAERIFDIFQRLHTREEYPGTGMGLAVCKRIVQRHGGRMWAVSQPGHGSSFYFTLPVRDLHPG